ncbi:MAG: hypothetical protein ABSC32_20570 [Steroidobacteraceae bacterium]|jgi:hypothetical protein
MDLRVLAGVFCGVAFTLAVVSFADTPRPQSQCTMQVSEINARLTKIEKSLAAVPALSSDVASLKATDTANVKWQGDAMQKLNEINLNLLNFQANVMSRH